MCLLRLNVKNSQKSERLFIAAKYNGIKCCKSCSLIPMLAMKLNIIKATEEVPNVDAYPRRRLIRGFRRKYSISQDEDSVEKFLGNK